MFPGTKSRMKVKIRKGNLLVNVSKNKLLEIIETISTEKDKKTNEIYKLIDVFAVYDGESDDMTLHLLEIRTIPL